MKFTTRSIFTLFLIVACGLMAWRTWYVESQRPPVPKFTEFDVLIEDGDESTRWKIVFTVWCKNRYDGDRSTEYAVEGWWYWCEKEGDLNGDRKIIPESRLAIAPPRKLIRVETPIPDGNYGGLTMTGCTSVHFEDALTGEVVHMPFGDYEIVDTPSPEEN